MFEFEVIQDLKPNDEIKEHNPKYSLKEIKQILMKLNFANYPCIILVSSKIMEMDSTQQNKDYLYLFNSINFNIKNCKSLDNVEQMF